jgi:UPF0755 protein
VTIRGGRGPRDQARPMEPGAYDGANMPTWRASDGRGNPPQGRRPEQRREPGGLPGFLRFALFAGILAVVVVIAGLTALRPLVRAAVVGWAWDNPGSLRLPFVADFIREDLGRALTDKETGSADEVTFEVTTGDTIAALATRLRAKGFVENERAFVFVATEADLAPKLQAGLYILRRDMTPAEVEKALVDARVITTTVDVTFREGLRLEQITAKLEKLTSGVVPKDFYDLVTHPTAKLLADYPWLADIPDGVSLEGFLYPATYKLVTASNGPVHVTTADDLVRMMLDKFGSAVGDARMRVPAERGLTFYQVVTLASIVEREAILDEERPLIAGVYQNRLDPKKWSTGLLESDPTVFYVNDSLQLQQLDFSNWLNYLFWAAPNGQLPSPLPDALAGYNTYTSKGLPPGPICSPTTASIDAALAPNTGTGYLFFVAKGDGSGSSAFAKTLAEHLRNVATYKK